MPMCLHSSSCSSKRMIKFPVIRCEIQLDESHPQLFLQLLQLCLLKCLILFPLQSVVRTSDVRVSNRVNKASVTLKRYPTVYNDLTGEVRGRRLPYLSESQSSLAFQDSKLKTERLHGITPGLQGAKIDLSVRAPSRGKLLAPRLTSSGLQRSPLSELDLHSSTSRLTPAAINTRHGLFLSSEMRQSYAKLLSLHFG